MVVPPTVNWLSTNWFKKYPPLPTKCTFFVRVSVAFIKNVPTLNSTTPPLFPKLSIAACMAVVSLFVPLPTEPKSQTFTKSIN